MDFVIERQIELLTACLFAGIIILFIIVMVLWRKLSNIKKRIELMFGGIKVDNVELVLVKTQENQKKQDEINMRNETMLQSLQEQIVTMKSNVGLIRYNAFPDQGSDLSFSVAWLDQKQNGLVLTGLHGRDQSYVYAKPVKDGASQYVLSEEEIEAINRSLK